MKHLKNQKGFTLIELMIVIAIIGILAAIALPQFAGASDKAKEAKAQATITSVVTAAETWYAENGKYPTNAEITSTTSILKSLPNNTVYTGTPDTGYKVTYNTTFTYEKPVTGVNGPWDGFTLTNPNKDYKAPAAPAGS